MLTPQQFQSQIWERYRLHKRTFPWRETTNGYYVLVSEIMLQQTQAERVVSKYNSFLNSFPDVYALQQASKTDLLSHRSGLGFNRRALNLQRSASIIADEYEGVIPDDEKTLLSLPGVGPYTANAILAFVYNMDVSVVDINIKRVFIVSLGLDRSIKESELKEIVGEYLPRGRAKERYNALMDYGALEMTAKKTGIKSAAQSPFVGSKRWVRGQVLKIILPLGSISHKELKNLIDNKYLEVVLLDLVAEGFLTEEEALFKIA